MKPKFAKYIDRGNIEIAPEEKDGIVGFCYNKELCAELGYVKLLIITPKTGDSPYYEETEEFVYQKWETNLIPEKVTRLQLQIALIQLGKDLTLVNNAVENHLTGKSKLIAQAAWLSATNIYRNNSIVGLIAQALSMTNAEIDNVFMLANKINLNQ